VTAGTFVVHPEVERITICEIEPRIPPLSAKYFGHENHDVIKDRPDARGIRRRPPFRTDNDGEVRHYHQRPDSSLGERIAPLYSTEYFRLVKEHLNPGGFVTQWVPLYESSVETVQSELATFFEAFRTARCGAI